MGRNKTTWKPGEAPKSPGRPKGSILPPKQKLTVQEFNELLSDIKAMPVEKLIEIRNDKTSRWELSCMASIILTSLKKGDPSGFDAIMDRQIGKPKEVKEITIIDEAKLALIQQKRDILKSILEERKRERPAEYLAEGLLIEKKDGSV